MTSFISRFRDDKSGTTAVEYGLIALFMSGAIVTSVPALRDAVQSLYLIVSATVPGSQP